MCCARFAGRFAGEFAGGFAGELGAGGFAAGFAGGFAAGFAGGFAGGFLPCHPKLYQSCSFTSFPPHPPPTPFSLPVVLCFPSPLLPPPPFSSTHYPLPPSLSLSHTHTLAPQQNVKLLLPSPFCLCGILIRYIFYPLEDPANLCVDDCVLPLTD